MHHASKLFLIAALLALSACGGERHSNGNAAAASGAPAADAIAVKKTGHADGVDFTVTSVSTTGQIAAAAGGPKAEAGETFVIVGYTLKNTSDKPMPLMSRPGLSLVDPSGQSLSPDDLATPMAAITAGGDPTGVSADLNPKITAKTKAAWKVDKASFDRATWRLVVASDPQLTFKLK